MKVVQLSIQLLSSILALALIACVEGSSRPAGVASTVAQILRSRVKQQDMTSINNSTKIDIVFSDIDGTLIHYPKNLPAYLQRKATSGICLLPASSTGMVGVISSKSLQLIGEIRQSGAIFVLVSGMRSSTLLKRLPYLPKADAYCCEAGGRIFYPTQLQSLATYRVFPETYSGAASKDMQPFSLIEDMKWRNRMEQVSAAGVDGFVGKELYSHDNNNSKEISFSERQGLLWDFARSLSEKGFIIDATGYCTCFRINRKQQEDSTLFDLLVINCIKVPPNIAFSTNLGCVDFYPTHSGKKNCCDYLRLKFFGHLDRTMVQCLCLCDDDNDIEMALSCLHAYLPLISSESMEDCVKLYPANFTVISMSKDMDDGVEATEKALALVLERINLI